MNTLLELDELVRERNQISRKIAARIRRPALIGHVGEYVASLLFDIELERSATNPGFDGRFRGGPLAGRTVNVKWYGRQEGVLDLLPNGGCELVLFATPADG